MSPPPLALLATLLFLATAVLSWMVWRAGKAALRTGLNQRVLAKETGSHRPRLEHPWVDLSRCIGCASCVRACPEQGVLEVIHGQAAVVHGSRCIGHGECAAHCPVGALALTMADRRERNDLPAVLQDMEAAGQPGLYLAGEITGYALIRTAVDHGRRAARGAQRRAQKAAVAPPPGDPEILDLCVVGAGPAGLACSLESKRLGLRFVTLEQDRIGGTIARYPRRKLLNTQALELPLGGRLEGRTYHKEELMELWQQLCTKHQLPILEKQVLEEISCDAEGIYLLRTQDRQIRARSVCLAVGRRGIPEQLGVEGEGLMKVNYSLIDAHAYCDARFMVVGGGDSAIETALGLAEQRGNQVHISYRRKAFFRLRARNELRIQEAIRAGRVRVHWQTTVYRIEEERVLLRREDPALPLLAIPNDEVFILAGGTPPLGLLEQAGVSFDPRLSPDQSQPVERGSGLLPPLLMAAFASAALVAWGFWAADYYEAGELERRLQPRHSLLHSASGVGLAAGITAATMMAANLLYLVRRSRWLPLQGGSLRHWMTAHVGTGMLALLFAILHGTFELNNSLGGHALLGLIVLVATGALGRYFYSFVPRAANGRELALDEARLRLYENTQAWTEVHRDFGELARREIAALIDRTRWQHGALGSVIGLVRAQFDMRRTLRLLRQRSRAMQVDAESLSAVLRVARKAHRDALAAAHFDDLRTLLAGWRYLHRWVGLLVVFLVVAHVWVSLLYADFGERG